MKKILSAGVMAGLIILMGSLPAATQPRPAVGRCEVMAEVYGPQKLWWGRFSGGRKAKYSFYGRGIEYHTAEACFTQRGACQAWLYRLKSDWQFMPRWSECLRGYRG